MLTAVETAAPHLSLRRYGPSPGSHAHPHFQVLWGWRGALELEIEGRGARITAGRVAVIPPGARHDFWAGQRRDTCCAVLDATDERLVPFAARVLPAPAGVQRLFEFLQDAPDGTGWSGAVAPLLLQSLAWVGPAAPRFRGRAIDWAALEAWVDARLHEPIGLPDLARQVHLSPSQFAARCLQQNGLPPQAWLRERRLAAARRLRGSDVAVAEVARRCGYRSPSALTAALRRAG